MTTLGVVLAMLAGLLGVEPATPADAAPGDYVLIYGPYCSNGAGEVIFQVTNNEDIATELTFSVGPYTRDQTVPANTRDGSYPISGIADGTYTAQAFFFITEVARKEVTIDCAYDPPLSRPSVSTSLSGSTLSFSWPGVSGATKYDYRVLDDGTRIDYRINTTGRSHTLDLGSRTGNICVYVTAKAGGRQSSSEGYSCKTRNPQPLARPTIDIDVTGNLMMYSWDAVPGATKYDFRVTDDGTDVRVTTNTTGRAWNMSLNGRSGSICVHVTAKASGRQSSPEAERCHRIVQDTPLAKPSVSSSINGNWLLLSWPGVSGATKYDYRVLDDGTRIDYKINTTGRSHWTYLGSRSGNICVYVTAKADGRQSSQEGYSCETRVVQTPLDTPRPSSDSRGVTGVDVDVGWGDIDHADRYSIRIERNDGHYAYRGSSSSDLAISFPITGVYCFYVTALPESGSTTHTQSRESEPPACTIVGDIAPPALTTWMRDNRLHFSIEEAPGAAEYHWRVGDTSERGTRLTPGRSSIDLSEYVGTRKCLHVKAVWSDGRQSRESTGCNLVSTTPTPELRYNPKGAVDFTFAEVPGAIWYDLVLEHPDDDNVSVRVNRAPTGSVPIDDSFDDRVCGWVVPGRAQHGDPSNKVCIDAVATPELLGIASHQNDELAALRKIADAIELTGGMPGNPWLSGDPNDLSTMSLRSLSEERLARLDALVAEVGHHHFEAFIERVDAKIRRADMNYANHLYRMLPLSFIVGRTDGEFQRAVGALDFDQNSVITMVVNLSGIGGDAYAGQNVFIGTVKSSAVFAGLTLAAGGAFLIDEIHEGEFGNSAQDIVEVVGLGISGLTLVAALAGLGPIGLGIMAIVGLIFGILSIFLPDRTENEIEWTDPMSVVDQKLFRVRKEQLEEQVESLRNIVSDAMARLEPGSCIDRDDRDRGYRCYRPTDHMFVLGARDTADEVRVVHRFFDEPSKQWFGVIIVHPWYGGSSGWQVHLHERIRTEWESDYQWDDVTPVWSPTNGTIINFRNVNTVLSQTERILADHIAAGP